MSGDNINTNVYDIADDLQWKAKKNYTLNHAAERIKIYAKEKFKYNGNSIDFQLRDARTKEAGGLTLEQKRKIKI